MDLLKKLLTQKFIFPALIALIGGIIAFANWEANTFLSGWDTLHPEFNFPLAFERAINGVWRSDQGLGTVAIQSHMAELPRIFLLWVLSFIFPLDSLRYISMLAPLVIGPLGLYFLSLYVLGKNKYRHISSFLASLSYLCSLGTVQHFVVPLEMFTIHFAFLPWAILLLVKYLNNGNKKVLALFSLITVLLIPQAHTATLLYVYILAIFTTIFTFMLLNHRKDTILRGIFIGLITILINSYIIFPNLFAAKYHGEEVHNSRINRFFSQEAFAKNQQFGNIKDAAITRSFLFDWQLYDFDKNQSVDVVGPWKENLKNPIVLLFGYLVFTIALLGAIKSLIKHDKLILVLLPITIISLLMLLNGTFPMTILFENISKISETLKESLRFPFTKFSILYMMGLSIFFASGIDFIFSKINKSNLNKALTVLITAGFILYFLPALKGNLVSPAMRINIPEEYFQMFSFFNEQNKDERVAVLPIHSFWGWVYNDWTASEKTSAKDGGYQGAGFLQFGIKQPLLDRDHDRWSSINEQYQREMKYAIYSQNVNLIRDVINKYDVKWILFDTSVTNLSGYQNETLTWQIPDMLNRFDEIKLKRKFGENLYVYEVLNNKAEKASLYNNMPDAGPAMIGSHTDRIYRELKDYKTERILAVDPEAENYIFDEHFVGKINSQPIITINGTSPLSNIIACSGAKSKRSINGSVIRYESTNGSLCDYFAFPNLSHEKAYIITIESKNVKGFPLQVYVCNDLTLHCNQTLYLKNNNEAVIEAFVIPAYYDNGNGHTININNYSVKDKTSINDLVALKIYEHTPELFTSDQNHAEFINGAKIIDQTPGHITVKLNENISENTTLTLSERYHSGWKAFVMPETDSNISKLFNNAFPFISGKEIIDHFEVNNWKNGWDIDSNLKNKTVTFVFMPQYLEYLGLILAGIPAAIFLVLFIKKARLSGVKNRFKNINSFFEVKADILKNKIVAEKNKNMPTVTSFPYSIDLSDRKKYWQGLN